MIAIIDYDAGNLKSVQKALDFLHQECVITRDFHEIRQADKVILPGVGSFGEAMAQLKSDTGSGGGEKAISWHLPWSAAFI